MGCHTDAHEQAKWFGDDSALKALEYEYKMPSLSGAIANLKLIGSTETPLSRFRVLLELAIGGYRDLNGMIEHHARMARMLGEQLGLPEPVLAGLESSYEQWDGKGWPGKLSGEQVPLASPHQEPLYLGRARAWSRWGRRHAPYGYRLRRDPQMRTYSTALRRRERGFILRVLQVFCDGL